MNYQQTAQDLYVLKQISSKKYSKELEKLNKKVTRNEFAYIEYLIDSYESKSEELYFKGGSILCN